MDPESPITVHPDCLSSEFCSHIPANQDFRPSRVRTLNRLVADSLILGRIEGCRRVPNFLRRCLLICLVAPQCQENAICHNLTPLTSCKCYFVILQHALWWRTCHHRLLEWVTIDLEIGNDSGLCVQNSDSHSSRILCALIYTRRIISRITVSVESQTLIHNSVRMSQHWQGPLGVTLGVLDPLCPDHPTRAEPDVPPVSCRCDAISIVQRFTHWKDE